MDAVSFVMGIQGKHLRASKLTDLIFRADNKHKPVKKASVELVYEYSEGSEIFFSRSISSSGHSNYRVNDQDVSFDKYANSLESIGVLVKVRNFLIFQGDVESIAQKSPIELTALLEEISGYVAFYYSISNYLLG